MRQTTFRHRVPASEVLALAHARRRAAVASPDDSVLLAASDPAWADGQTTADGVPTLGAAVMLGEPAEPERVVATASAART